MSQSSSKCEAICNKDEQLECHTEFVKIEKRKEVQVEVDIPWYKRKEHSESGGSCATDRGNCE